ESVPVVVRGFILLCFVSPASPSFPTIAGIRAIARVVFAILGVRRVIKQPIHFLAELLKELLPRLPVRHSPVAMCLGRRSRPLELSSPPGVETARN
ncbi:hypothetical protein OBBRIDRAFT_794386, partial [Obba rivulosa]